MANPIDIFLKTQEVFTFCHRFPLNHPTNPVPATRRSGVRKPRFRINTGADGCRCLMLPPRWALAASGQGLLWVVSELLRSQHGVHNLAPSPDEVHMR